MSTISLQLNQVTSAASLAGQAQYTVTNQILSSVGVDPAVFVFYTTTGIFSHYANPADLNNYPNTLQDAQALSAKFFRQPLLTRTWSTIDQMQDDLSMTQSRLQRLLNSLNELQGELIVNQTINLSAGC
jgi:hypothetical protein